MWNWQNPKWPQFIYDNKALAGAERVFLEAMGEMKGTLSHLDDLSKVDLVIDVMSKNATDSASIEGEILSRESVQFSLRKNFGLATDNIKSTPADRAMAGMMVSLYREVNEPLSHQTLMGWHSTLMQNRRDLDLVGTYRKHDEPMNIVSGSYDSPEIHFTAPPSGQVKGEMDRLIKWYEQTRSHKDSISPIIRSGLTHIWFESIHPFEDGNGRIGRALSEKALVQGLDRVSFVFLSETINRRKKEYYKQLADASKTLDVTHWLLWFASIIIESQRRTLNSIIFTIEKAKFLAKYDQHINERQKKVLLRLFKQGPGGFTGGLSSKNYISITDTSTASATRDLRKLVEIGALAKTGEKKSSRYYLNIGVKEVARVDIEDIS